MCRSLEDEALDVVGSSTGGERVGVGEPFEGRALHAGGCDRYIAPVNCNLDVGSQVFWLRALCTTLGWGPQIILNP